MKVGIITYHFHYNYGTMLQALALQNAVDDLGMRAEIIDFYQPNEKSSTEIWKIRKSRITYYMCHPQYIVKKGYNYIILKKNKKCIERKQKCFDEFYKNTIHLSDKHYSSSNEIEENPPIYDIYVVGSDQTWNPYTGGNPDAFYLTFAPRDKKRVSYAPSVSVQTIDCQQRERLVKLLENVEKLSCREEEGSLLLRNMTHRNVITVLDPTFLLSKEIWRKYSKKVQVPKKYILQYLIGEKKEHREYIQRLSQKLKIPVVSIPCAAQDMRTNNTIKIWGGPGEFLFLIENANLICTDSFHGTAFSLNYRKSVYSFYKNDSKDVKSENSRLNSIYDQFGIGNRIITDLSTIPNEKEIYMNYTLEIEENIHKQIVASKNYLKSILGVLYD